MPRGREEKSVRNGPESTRGEGGEGGGAPGAAACGEAVRERAGTARGSRGLWRAPAGQRGKREAGGAAERSGYRRAAAPHSPSPCPAPGAGVGVGKGVRLSLGKKLGKAVGLVWSLFLAIQLYYKLN